MINIDNFLKNEDIIKGELVYLYWQIGFWKVLYYYFFNRKYLIDIIEEFIEDWLGGVK